jgi:hypothetical protein
MGMLSRSTKNPVSNCLSRVLLVSIAVFLVVFALFTLLWARYIRPDYFPYGDSFSLLVSSIPPFHPSIVSWFLQGFQSYFDAYPDLSLHATNFIRPGVNATFYLGYFIHHEQWSHYLLTTYAIIALIAALNCFLSAYVLKLSWRITLLTTLCVAVVPSIDTGAIFDPTFAFDLLVGLLVLAGVTSFICHSNVLAWIFLTFAVFTKETALFAPVIAALLLFFRRQERALLARLLSSASFLTPVVAWLILRWYAFHGEKGVYVLMDGSSTHGPIHAMAVRTILGILSWPLSTMEYWPPIPSYLVYLQKLSVAVNISFWIVTAILLLKAFRNRIRLAQDFTSLFEGSAFSIVVLFLFCLGSLPMPIALNLPRRFGGVCYPLFLLCMAIVTERASTRALRMAAVCMIAIIGFSGALLITSDLRYQTTRLRATWAISRHYVDVLSHSTEPALFSVADTAGHYASNEHIQAFSGYRGQLIRVGDLTWNFTCTDGFRIAIEKRSKGSVSITSALPKECGGFAFYSVFPPIDAQQASLTRHLPVATLQYQAAAGTDSKSAMNQIHIELQSNVPDSGILLPEPGSLQYRKVLLKSLETRIPSDQIAINKRFR